MKYERNCIVCGKRYSYCGNCADFINVPTWKYIYCSENCRNVFKTIESYKLGELDVKEASSKLANTNVVIDNKTILADCAQIYSEAGKIEKTVVKEETKDDVEQAIVDENSERKNKQMRSKYYK